MGHPIATTQNIRDLWAFLWRTIEQVRRTRCDLTCRPRLRTLRVVEGLHKEPQSILLGVQFEQRREMATFEARLNERDDLAQQGHADVVCLELEGLQEKYGRGPLANEFQEKLLEEITLRAQVGRRQSMKLTTGLHDEILRPLKTSLLKMVDAN